ncbi:MAG: sigma-70 family RNA polymerase sigma factor [Planctomycetes bacterium]|nr:sigma-70 family RNA polymerase sigma factor [Planctomycetota bacterium]
MTAERDLAQMARTGDRNALDALARRWDGPVFAVCLRFLGRPDEARDAVQETFKRMITSIATFDPARDFGPWVLSIARNCSRDLLQKRGRSPAALDETPEPAALPPVTPNPDVETLRALLPKLPAMERAVLELRLRHDLSLEDIARELQMPAGTVRSHASRAIGRLRAWMKEEAR